MRKILVMMMLGAGVLAAGCQNMSLPRLESDSLNLHQDRDRLRMQRDRANQFDPYPEDEVGPSVPEMRPPGFRTPPPEPSRARYVRPSPF